MTMQSCTMQVADAHTSVADTLWRALLAHLEGDVPFAMLARTYQISSEYVPFLECVRALGLGG